MKLDYEGLLEIINEVYEETEQQKKIRQRHNNHSYRKSYPSQRPENKLQQPQERLKAWFPGASDLFSIGRGIVENLEEEILINPEDQQLRGFMDMMKELGYTSDEELEEKKKGRKKQCSKGNRFHLGGNLGKKSGQFQSGNKSGSSSIANDAKYAGKKDCVRGRARWTGSNERWVNPDCGRAAREKGEDRKCSVKEGSAGPTVRVPEKVRIPATANGQIDLYKVSKALMDKKNHILKLQRIVNHLKKRKDCKRLSFAQGLNLVRNTVLSTKGKTDNEVEAKLRKQSKK